MEMICCSEHPVEAQENGQFMANSPSTNGKSAAATHKSNVRAHGVRLCAQVGMNGEDVIVEGNIHSAGFGRCCSTFYGILASCRDSYRNKNFYMVSSRM